MQRPEDVLNVGDKIKAKVINIDSNDRKIGLSIREMERDADQAAHAKYGTSGDTGSVSIGDVVGDAVPASLLRQGKDISEAANEMLSEGSESEGGEAVAEDSDTTES